MKYRKKPVAIDAEQFWRDKKPWPNGVYEEVGFAEAPYLAIKTLEGPLHVSEGDWIITGVKGERYPCKPDIFAATYEAVEPDTPTPAR